MADIEEIRRINQVLRRHFDQDGHLINIHPYPENAFKLAIYRELFNNADGPEPLTEEEAATTYDFGQNRITKQAIRTHMMELLEILIDTMTSEPEYIHTFHVHDNEQRIINWLHAITPVLEQSEVQLPSSSTSRPTHHREPSMAMTNGSDAGGVAVESTDEATNVNQQVQGTEHDQQNIHVPNPPAIAAPQPQSIQQPVYFQMPAAGPFPIAAPVQMAPFYPYTRVGNGMMYQPGPQPVPYYAPSPFQLGGVVGQQTTVGIPPQAPQFTSNYGPLYPPPMPQQAYNIPPFGYGQAFPIFQQPLPVMGNQQVSLSGQGQAPSLPSPSQQRNTLPPASREASRSTWANSRVQDPSPNVQRVPTSFVSGYFQANCLNPSASSNQASSAQLSTTPVNAISTRYGPNSDTMYPTRIGGRSEQLQKLTQSGTSELPSYSAVIDSTVFPFEETARNSAPVSWGVIRIDNIPYAVTKPEVIVFLGQNAQIASYGLGSAIHITMDRITGKTNDCFVEFTTIDAAQATFNSKTRPGQINRIGERLVNVSMSSQDELLNHLFPKAVNVQWQNSVPSITGSVDPFNSGFKCLVTSEECHMMKQHAHAPQRSQYTRGCPQRVYEWMISTLCKFPWYAVDMYTLKTRNDIYDTLVHLLRILLNNVDQGAHPLLNQGLVQELLYAGLNAPGFSEKQRWDLTRDGGVQGRSVKISPLAKHWPFNVLGRKTNVPEDVMVWYVDRLTRHLDIPTARPTMNPFRTFILPPNRGLESTAAEMGALELQCVLEIYKMTLPE